MPLSLYPPKGEAGSNLLKVLAHITPAFNFLLSLKILEPFSVQTPADKPKGVLLAFSITSSIVLNVWIVRTGPKISS